MEGLVRKTSVEMILLLGHCIYVSDFTTDIHHIKALFFSFSCYASSACANILYISIFPIDTYEGVDMKLFEVSNKS
jgi:hypothetical protein